MKVCGNRVGQFIAIAFSVLALTACQGAGSAPSSTSSPTPPADAKPRGPDHITFPAPMAWGGEARCMADGCKVVYVEHEAGQVVLKQFQGRKVVELDRKPVAYHPDSAKWLTDDWVVAAVEKDQTLDLFSVSAGRLTPHAQIRVPFAPRDVVVLEHKGGTFTLLATPYSGKGIAVVRWTVGAKTADVKPVQWCEAPWHPAVVERAPQAGGLGAVVSCLDDKKLLYVSAKDWTAKPTELAQFKVVARQARPSPTGKWTYVALEVGEQNARVNMDTGETQYLASPPGGAVSVLALEDDLVIWGGASSLYLQRLDPVGKVLETKWLPASGFPTNLQLIDLDGDGQRDLLILNSADDVADVFYGPLWDRALEKL